MNFEVKVNSTIDEKFWNQNLIKTNDVMIYQIPSFSKVYEDAFGSIPIYILIENNGEVVGQLAAIIHNKYYWRNSNSFLKYIASKLNLNSVLRWEYGPIIHDKSNQDEILSKILSTINTIALNNKVTMIRGTVNPLDVQPSEQVFGKFGYHKKYWGTYVTNLNQNVDELYEKLSKETRYDIRKSEKNELEFIIADSFKEYDEYVNFTIKIKESRSQLVKKDELFNHKFWDILHDEGYLKLFLVKKNGELLGGMEALVFNNNVLQYGISISPSGQKMQAGSFLTWNVIKWAKNNKYRIFDLSGINPNPETEKESSIRFFKSKWCGKQLDYAVYVKVIDKFRFYTYSILNNPHKLKKLINFIK